MSVGGPTRGRARGEMSTVIVTDNPEQTRFEAMLDDKLVGLAEYRLRDGLIVFTHTEVFPEYEGRGIGSALAKYALDQVSADGARKVVPACPFIERYIVGHPEYGELIAS